jgi:hypothetical protein
LEEGILIEKRQCDRSETTLYIDCQLLSLANQTNQRNGILYNYSLEGAYIELPCPYRKGNILWIRPQPKPPASPDEKAGACHCMGLVEVIWVRTVESTPSLRFGIGLKMLF